MTAPASEAPSTTPCGEPTTSACPGPDITFNRHTHPGDERTDHGSFGRGYDGELSSGGPGPGVTIRSAHSQAHADAERIDRNPINWCPRCQNTLVGCYQSGCARAKETLVGFAWVAARYAVATVVGQRGGRRYVTDAQIADLEYKLLQKITMGLPRLSFETEEPTGPRKSTVAFLSEFAVKAGHTHLSTLTEGEGGSLSLSGSALVSPEEMLNRAEQHRELQAAGDHQAAEHTHVLTNVTVSLPEILLAAIEDDDAPGTRHSAKSILTAYLGQYVSGRASNRTYRKVRCSDALAAQELDVGRSTPWRCRTKILLPRIRALVAADPTHTQLTPAQIQVLTHFLNWLSNDDDIAVTTTTAERERLNPSYLNEGTP